MGLYPVNCVHCGKPFMWFSGHTGGLAECPNCVPPTQIIATNGTTIPTGTMVGKLTTTPTGYNYNTPSMIDMTPTPHHVGCRRCNKTWMETGFGPQMINGAYMKYDYCSECKDDPKYDSSILGSIIGGNITIK
jgi:hypothetical protein